jgi:hypothetical protein
MRKRMCTFIVNTRWHLPDGTHLTRKIAENGVTAASAKRKVEAHYGTPSMRKKLGVFYVVSVTREECK